MERKLVLNPETGKVQAEVVQHVEVERAEFEGPLNASNDRLAALDAQLVALSDQVAAVSAQRDAEAAENARFQSELAGFDAVASGSSVVEAGSEGGGSEVAEAPEGAEAVEEPVAEPVAA